MGNKLYTDSKADIGDRVDSLFERYSENTPCSHHLFRICLDMSYNSSLSIYIYIYIYIYTRLTLDEKVSLIGGNGFCTKSIKKKFLPSLYMVDGPNGIRGGHVSTQGPATVFPCGVAMGASFDEELIQQVGVALASEAKHKGCGSHILLGPALNIQRRPDSGTNIHTFGEDPFLMSRLGVSYVLGVQSQGLY